MSVSTSDADILKLMNTRTGPPPPELIAAVDSCIRTDTGNVRASQYIPGFAKLKHTMAWELWEYTEKGDTITTIALVVRDKEGAILQPASKTSRPKTTLSLIANVDIYADPADKMEHSREKGYAPVSAKSSVLLTRSDQSEAINASMETLRAVLTENLADATVELTKSLRPKHHAVSEEALVNDSAKFLAVVTDQGDDRWALPVAPATADEPNPKMTFGRKLLSKSWKGPPADADWEMFGDAADWVRQGAADHTPQALKVLLSDGKTYVPPHMLKEIRRGATALVEVVFQGWFLNSRNKNRPQHTIVSWVSMAQLYSNGTGGGGGSAPGVDLEAAMAAAETAKTVVADAATGIAVPRKAEEAGGGKSKKRRM
jgi:hypothetical protein